MAKHSIEIKRFDLGLNTKTTPLHGKPEESPNCQDVEFSDLGAVGTRTGYSVLNTAAIATQPIDCLDGYVMRSGTKQLLAWCNGTLHYLSGTTFITVPSADGVATAVKLFEFHL